MRRKIVTAFLLAAALAFMPMGGNLAMTAEATGTEATEGSETAEAGTVEDSSEEEKEQVVLGWTEDGKPDVYVDPDVVVMANGGGQKKFSEVGLENTLAFEPSLWKDGERVPLGGPNGDSLRWILARIASNVKSNGSGTYKYAFTFTSNPTESSEFVYVAPGEEEPGENGGNTTESGSNTAESGSNTTEAPQPEPWVPTPEEVKLYAACGTETPEFTENTDNAYSVTVMNSIQGFLCWNAFDSVRGDYTIGRTYNIYPTASGMVYSMDSKAKITLTIPEELRAKNRSFRMLVVSEDGKPAVLKDLDSDPNTITFETDSYYAFALAYRDKAN